MGILNSFFGGSEKFPHKIVYAETIEKISSSDFRREIKVMVDGEKKVLKESGVKDWLKDLVYDGISLNQLDTKLKAAGLVDSQIERRKEVMAIVQKYVK